MIRKLKIGTYNIRNITDHYSKRKNLLEKTLHKMSFDIAGLQEVSFLNYNQLNDLNLSQEYIEFKAKTQLTNSKTDDKEFIIDGNVILIRKEIIENSKNISHKILHLFPTRCAQMISFEYNNLKLNVVNLHLHHLPEEEMVRLYEIKMIHKWIEENTNENELIYILGDFNALPTGNCYDYLKQQNFVSLYHHHNGFEPDKTFHNKMKAPFFDDADEGTFDYIFVKKEENLMKKIKLEDVKIFGQEESELDEGIFASDHYALVAEFDLY